MKPFEFLYSWLRRIFFAVVKLGQIPTHVVFLITQVPSYYGVAGGFDGNIYKQSWTKIMACVEWCLTLGVTEVSFYTFDCLIYKLPTKDLKKYIHALNEALSFWLRNSTSLREKGIKIHVADRCSVLPEKTKVMADKIQRVSQMNSKIVVNIIIGFLEEKDLTRKMKNFQTTVKNASISRRHRSIRKLYKNFFNYKLQNPQLIISNCCFKRLNDYLVWKIPSRYMHHIHIIWNKFSWFHFFVCILYFQTHRRLICKKVSKKK